MSRTIISALAALAMDTGRFPSLGPAYMGKLRGFPNDKKRAAKAKFHAAQVGKVACCHKQHHGIGPIWFATTEERNAHKEFHR